MQIQGVRHPQKKGNLVVSILARRGMAKPKNKDEHPGQEQGHQPSDELASPLHSRSEHTALLRIAPHSPLTHGMATWGGPSAATPLFAKCLPFPFLRDFELQVLEKSKMVRLRLKAKPNLTPFYPSQVNSSVLAIPLRSSTPDGSSRG